MNPKGWIDLATGEVDLDFASSFATSLAGGLWATQPLAVAARMASGEQAGTVFHAVGERLRGADATCVRLWVMGHGRDRGCRERCTGVGYVVMPGLVAGVAVP